MSDIIKILGRIDIGKMEYQIINDCAITSTVKKGGNEVTFCTNELSPNQLMTGTGKRGILIWVDPEDLTAAINK